MNRLFSPFTLRDLTFRNRIFVSPMCQYSSENGMPNDWHLVHLGSRAVGGAGLVMVEATGVTPEGRISPKDSGIWSDAHAVAFRRITDFIRSQGAASGIQLAHAGRKASTKVPWDASSPETVPPEEGGWQAIAPSAVKFLDDYPLPREMTAEDIAELIAAFKAAARRARDAGFDVVELHAAHGYLVHEFLSPLSNFRKDEWGGTFAGRTKLALDIARAVRAVHSGPLFVRISATDWMPGGWDLPQSIELAKLLKEIGVDLIDVSTGGAVPGAKIPVGAGFQVPFARAIRAEVGIPTAAVGLITDSKHAEQILESGDADAVMMARQMLRDPYFALHAARELGDDVKWPVQYARAK